MAASPRLEPRRRVALRRHDDRDPAQRLAVGHEQEAGAEAEAEAALDALESDLLRGLERHPGMARAQILFDRGLLDAAVGLLHAHDRDLGRQLAAGDRQLSSASPSVRAVGGEARGQDLGVVAF